MTNRLRRRLIAASIRKALRAIENVTEEAHRFDAEAGQLLDSGYHRIYLAGEKIKKLKN